jgi:hypothetical protein
MGTASETDRPKESVGSDRRRSRRVALAVQIEVSGMEPTGAFRDRALTTDVNEHGCQFILQRKLRPGEQVTIALANADADPIKGNHVHPFEVVWAEHTELGWAIGVRKLTDENIWPLTFPAKH